MATPSFIVATRADTSNRGQHQLMAQGGASTGSTGDTNDPTGGGGFNPLAILIKNTNRFAKVAPGVGADVTYAMKKNANSPVNLSGNLVISGTNHVVTADVEATLPAVANGDTNTNIKSVENWINEWHSTAPPTVNAAGGNGAFCFEYQVPSHDGVSFFMLGTDFGSMSFSGTQSYSPIVGPFSSLTTRADVQMPWPVSGTFQYLSLVWKGLSTGTSVQVAFEINSVLGSGGDVIGPFTLSAASPTGNWQSIVDLVSTAAITAGQYVNWRIIRTAGAGTSINCVFTLGFHT